jgi:hypothetical protein
MAYSEVSTTIMRSFPWSVETGRGSRCLHDEAWHTKDPKATDTTALRYLDRYIHNEPEMINLISGQTVGLMRCWKLH